jgi:hypothetical protein
MKSVYQSGKVVKIVKDRPATPAISDPANSTDEGLIDRAISLLRSILPAEWQVERQAPLQAEGRADDALLVLRISSQHVQRILVEGRRTFAPRDVDTILGRRLAVIRQATGELPMLVVAPWLSERSRRRLTEAGLNYLDLTGNMRIVITNPALFIERTSTTGPPRTQRSAPALRGPKAGRVVRLLADVAPPYGVLELAAASGVTPGYMSRLVDMLDREALVERTRRGGVTSVDWAELLRRRADSYSVLETNAVTRYVCPNGAAFALEAARDLHLPKVWLTGSFAAEQIVKVAAPTLLLLYATGGIEELVRVADMLPADEGANVMILSPYDSVVTEGGSRWVMAPLPPTVPLVACTQLVLDCLTGPGRMPAEGEALLAWMAEKESSWRLGSLADLPEPAGR